MDGDWEEVGRLLLPPPAAPQAGPSSVATFAFDNSQELLWVGNATGRVSSFYSTELSRYTTFKAGDGLVRQLLFHEKGVIALCEKSIHMAMRRGPPIWHITHEGMTDLRCMSWTSKGASELLVAGFQDVMFTIDVEKGVIAKEIPSNDHYTIMRRSRYICAATKNGSVDILDSVNFRVLKTWKAHSSLISDMDAQHDFIVTCGYSLRAQQQSYMLDPLVNVFDLKNLTSMAPVPFPAGAAYVRMHPRMSTTSIIVSQHGQIHIVDLMNVNTSNMRQANVLDYLCMVEIAPSGEAMALADAGCNIHLWGSPSRIRFAEFSSSVEFADTEESAQHLDWGPDNGLNTIGLPFYRDYLLSAWPNHMVFEVGAPPPKIDPHLLSTAKVDSWGHSAGYVRSPRGLRRNQVENTRAAEKSAASLQAPKFLSEKARESANDSEFPTERRISDVADAMGQTDISNLKEEVPVMYSNVEIKYSKFGVDDFDFGYYNKTSYSGLETHISNSYANSLLQVMHFTPLIRNLTLQHTATACVNDQCLLCELGFLFDMLEKAEGSICQATNFLKTLSIVPGAAPILEENVPDPKLTTLLQSLDEFLFPRLSGDFRSMPPYASTFDQVMTLSATQNFRCTTCRNEHTRPGSAPTQKLSYPQKLASRNTRSPKFNPTFSQIMKLTLELEGNTRGWCSRCQRYRDLASKRTVHSIPAVLMLHANITSPEAKQFWATPNCLPSEIGIIKDQGQVFCFQGDEMKQHIQRGMHNITVYSLIGLVADIDSGQHQKSHLVSLVNVAHSQPKAPAESQWHLFNDFLVRPIKAEEALSFNTSWKLPSIITYQAKGGNNRIDNSWKHNLDTSLLYIDHNKNPGERTYKPLQHPQEAPKEGTIIGLDTEFVAIRQPEIEMNSDGERETIRPIAFALARVSVVRGSGEDEGLPFIDDYIASKEPIVDYLTSYSGIVQGDLDPLTSRHNLVSLKIAYKKLWILLNLGCHFLGHGLKQDFRVTNIHVPKAQIIDTIEFFFVKSRLRKLSLSFLAWCLLKEDIQVETHDSIEDARTALKLYRKYQEFKDAGILETMLQDIYKKGREMNYKAPAVQKRDGTGGVIERTETPELRGTGQEGTGGGGSGHVRNVSSEGGAAGVLSGVGLRPTTPVRRAFGGGSGWTPGKSGGSTTGFGGSPLR